MKILNAKESMNYQGGAKITMSVATVIGGVVVFLLGLYDGIKNPKACRIKR